MSSNKYMHPRNIYKSHPDFTVLAISYPEFRTVCTIDTNGRTKIDFKNEETLRALTKCLLKKDFNLDVTLPANKLIPTLPLRLNYILWIEDIMLQANIPNPCGIDIGCGASCIYPLLAAVKNRWKMIGLEINPESINYARENIRNNNLNDFIVVLEQNENEIFSKINFMADFSMCNPPFYNSVDQLNNWQSENNRTGHRKPPNNIRTGSTDELTVPGGEIEFIKQIILESISLKNRIKVYTTMIGHKSNVTILLKFLRDNQISNNTVTEFCQGHTTRWGLAWCFSHSILLRKVPTYGGSDCLNRKRGFSYTVNNETDLNQVFVKLTNLLKTIQITIYDVTMNPNQISCNVIAWKNTWSNLRRKRREIQRNPQLQNKINTEIEYFTCDEEQMQQEEDEEQEEPLTKRLKIDNGSTNNTDICDPILIIGLQIHLANESSTVIDLEYLYGISDKDGVHQILQFIINNWK